MLPGQVLSADAIGGGSGHVIKDEGGAGLPAQPNLNFTGAGVTAANNAGTNSTDVTIPGGIGNGSSQYQTIITGGTPFAPVYSGFLLDGTTGGKTILAVTNTKTLTLTSTGDFNMTVPATGTVAMLNQANSFTLINPLTTIAESWIGPSSTTGIYFKGGNVGIGTTGPDAKLTIGGGNAGGNVIQSFYNSSGTVKGYLGVVGTAGNYIDTGAVGDFLVRSQTNLLFGAGGSEERMRITTTGNVGIGITAPLARLHVTGTADDEVLILQANATQTANVFEMRISTTAHNILTVPHASNVYANVFNEQGAATLDFRVESDTYDALFIDASNDSIMLMGNAAGKVGFFGITAVVQQTELTDELTTVTCTAPGTPDYVIQDLVQNTGFGFVTADEGQSALKVIANLQTRVNELETKLVAYGLLVDAD